MSEEVMESLVDTGAVDVAGDVEDAGKGIRVGDTVRTGLGHHYRVVKIAKTKRFDTLIVCRPLTQQLWHRHFYFAPEVLTKVDRV